MLSEAIVRLDPQSLWQAMERDALLDDLITQTGLLCRSVLSGGGDDVGVWMTAHGDFVDDWERIGGEVLREEGGDFSMYAMAVRRLGDLLRTL